ncbi:hypothetical protein [Limnoglobus roseus]|uniref:SMI1/KNR4 family protein n=1 Tax=Limnoglobus roseus TaxID=2598579 RepID=A0A5C1A6F6_9BACT|nr:hypothetical protein [Limnoglobus roseus]QEL14310.1 SMI1/KNR4 family protein [Limnoglobus roseus]
MSPADEWAISGDPQRLLALLGNQLDVTGARIFAAGYFRHGHETDTQFPAAALAWLDEYERLALQRAKEPAWEKLRQRTPRGQTYQVHVLAAYFRPESTAVNLPYTLPTLFQGRGLAAARKATGPPPADVQPGHEWHQRFQAAYFAAIRPAAELLRCAFRNPHCDVPFEDRWRTETAAGLARTMFDARDFSGMPILADALQDAGCENDDVLNHCRADTAHARGCWVVDWVLNQRQ